MNDTIVHYGVEHHRVQSIAFNRLRRTDIYEEHKEDINREERQRVKRLKIENESKTKLLKEKEDLLKEFYYYNLAKKNQELAKQVEHKI